MDCHIRAIDQPRWGGCGVWGVGCRGRNSPNNQRDTSPVFEDDCIGRSPKLRPMPSHYTQHPTPNTLLFDIALFLRSVVRSLADRGKNDTLSPIRWEALSSYPLTAFFYDAGDQTVPIDVADSCTKNIMKLNPKNLVTAYLVGDSSPTQSLAQLRFASFKGSVRHRPRLHPQARGTGVLRAINKVWLIA
jgi:hypothetical protein